MNNLNKYIIILFIFSVFSSCTVSYKFNGASIDYTKTKSISITDFPNLAPLVYPPLSNMFSEGLRDKYTRQTRLELLRTGGDLDIEGEIVGYDIGQLSVGSDGYANETRLTLTINVRFRNIKNPEEDFERRYSSSQTFGNDRDLDSIQEELATIMIEDITDQIYNDTVAKW